MKPELSVWLLPESAREKMLSETIAHLAQVQGEKTFIPHVTIQGDLCHSPDELREPVAALANDVPVQHWRIKAVECGDHFFRCIYLRFDARQVLDILQGSLRVFTRTSEGLSPFPHLSLAYGKVTEDTLRERDALAASFGLEEIVFDRVAIVRSSKDVPIEAWQLLEVFPLKPR